METDHAGVSTRPTAQIVWFVVLAYALSWAWRLPLAFSSTVTREGQGWPTHLVGLLGPGAAACIVTAATEGRAGLRSLGGRVVRWRVGARWYALVAATAALCAIALVTSSGLAAADFTRYSGAPQIGLAVVGYVLVVNGFGEEVGWRGFLAERLLQRTSVGRTAVIVWVIWAGWHLPMFWVVENFRDFGVGGTIGWTVGIGFGSVFLTWLYRSASRSILVLALWHTAYNFTTATTATSGAAAAVASTAVIVAGVFILRAPSTWRDPVPAA